MKSYKKYFNRMRKFRSDALLLACLMFFQTISPVFLYGSEIEKNEDVGLDLSNNKGFYNEFNRKESLTNEYIDYKVPEEKNNKIKVGTPKLVMPGGPDQPEVQSFSPVGTDGMVDPFTGDFSYNIPLLEVDGYPVNIAYNAGVGMEQEASWVGLGWNLNPGVVNRNMRGIPDDFSGDLIKQEYNQKDNWTAGTSAGADLEVFSITPSNNSNDTIGGITVSASLGIQYNNFSGFNTDFSIGPSFAIAKKAGLNVGLEFTGSSQNGASVGANFSISDRMNKFQNVNNKLSIGSSFNSRQGIQQTSINLSSSISYKMVEKGENKKLVGSRDSDAATTSSGVGATFNGGMSTYVAQIPFSTNMNSFTARFKLGGDLFGVDATGTFTGFFSKSSLKDNEKLLNAYGYSNLQNGYMDNKAMLDFNRENDASFTKNTPALPIPHLTYDIYSVSGHGVSGSYRLDRQDIGYVFDPKVTSGTNSYTLGGEAGAGGTFKAGIDVGAVFSSAESGVWKEGNYAAQNIKYTKNNNYYRGANELSFDNSDFYFNQIGGDLASSFQLINFNTLNSTLRSVDFNVNSAINKKSLNFKRNRPFTSLTVGELKSGFGVHDLPSNSYAKQNLMINHHVGAFTVTKADGARYFYGLPAYSKTQKNVSFAVGEGKTPKSIPDWTTGIVDYNMQDASIANNRGLDNHYNSQTIPSYAHSYMLTAVLGANYVDSDDIKGPSKDDLGSYVSFKYKQVSSYKWKNPVGAFKAFHNNGLNTDPTDDKANYIYGEKELWYLDTIKGKNHVLIFHTSDRNDAVSVNDEHGGISQANAKMQKLDSIQLFTIPDLKNNGNNATPIKTVHFRYDYSLCRDYSGNINTAAQTGVNNGKLTLKKVYFTYEFSYKGERTPYEFDYGYNPKYNPKNIDRWGTYKRNPVGLTGTESTSPLSNSDFPYVGHNRDSTDLWASAWNLNEIHLPSGGKIEVDYESDSYSHVQHKKATQMFKIIGVEGCSNSNCSISDSVVENRKLYFEILPNTSIEEYGKKGDGRDATGCHPC